MTIEGPQTEQGSSAELISSKAPSSAELWDEVLQRLAEVQSMAPSSEATWNDVLQRIAEVQRAHTKLATAVDHLGAVLSSALVTEPRQDLAGRGIAAEFAVDADMPPLLVPKLPDIEVGEARDETPWLPEQSMAEALPTIEERETDGGQAPEATSEDGQPWLTEFAIFAPTDEHEVEEEQPWLAELALAETPSETTAMEVPESEALQTRPEIEHEQPILAEPVLAQTPAETVEEEEEPVVHVDAETAASFAPDEPHGALSGVSIFAPGRVVDMSPQVMDALLAAEFGEATVRLMDSEALTLDDLLAEEFAPTDQGTEARGAATPLLPLPTSEAEIHPPPSPPLPPPPADLLPPPLGDLPPSPFDSPLSTGESTLPVEPPPIPEPVAMTDTGDMEDTLTDVGTPDETTEFEAGSDLPPSPFDSTLSTGESTLPVEPPPIPEPVAMTDTGDVEDTVTDVGALDEATEFEAGSDLLPLPFDSPFSTEESTLPVEPQPPIPEPVAMTDTGVAMTDTSDVEDTLTDVGAPDEATEFEAGSDLPPLPFDSPPSTEESTLPVEPPAPIPEETPAPPVHELAQAAGPPPFLSAASMVTEILAATPGETPAADALPAETEAPEPQALPGQNVVSPDFTIISNKRRRFHLR